MAAGPVSAPHSGQSQAAMSDQLPTITDAQRRENERTYHLALGRFVDAFARVETLLQMVLCRHTRISHPASRAVFSGARTAVIRGYLRRLADVDMISAEQWAALEPVLQQLGIINDKRNDILHYGAREIDRGEGFVTNALMALTESRMTLFPISAPILTQMTFDCEKIILHLLYDQLTLGQLLAAPDPEHQRILQAAWQYKPPPQDQTRSRPGDTTAAHSPPPQSSPP